MNEEIQGREFSRQELYDRVWSTPGTKLAAELGISDVALAKRCKKLNVPRPSRGYWAKLVAGEKPPKEPLPLAPDEVVVEALNAPIPKTLPLPEGMEHLHPLALELLQVVNSATSETKQIINVEVKPLPRIKVSRMTAVRAAKALHVILTLVEARGISFCRSHSKYEPAYFEKGTDQLYLTIEEETITVSRPHTAKGRHSSYWRGNAAVNEPSGRLTFSISDDRYRSGGRKRWGEEDKVPLEKVLSRVVEGICQHYIELEKQHAAEKERQQREYEAYEIRQQAEQKRKHEEAVENIGHARAEDLFKAAEWWRLNRMIDEFIRECEQHWRKDQEGALTQEQENWLGWARDVANAMSPFESGYPDPTKDGPFDSAAIPFGGPYPPKRDFPRPPTMPEINPPAVQAPYGVPSYTPQPSRYPFWLKYQRR